MVKTPRSRFPTGQHEPSKSDLSLAQTRPANSIQHFGVSVSSTTVPTSASLGTAPAHVSLSPRRFHTDALEVVRATLPTDISIFTLIGQRCIRVLERTELIFDSRGDIELQPQTVAFPEVRGPSVPSSAFLSLSSTIINALYFLHGCNQFSPHTIELLHIDRHRNPADIQRGITVSAVAFLGLLILAALLFHRHRRSRRQLGLHANHSSRGFMVHPRAEDEDEWKQATRSPTNSPTSASGAQSPQAYSPLATATGNGKPPHYIVHSARTHRRSASTHTLLWAESLLPMSLSRAPTPAPVSAANSNPDSTATGNRELSGPRSESESRSPSASSDLNSPIQLLRMNSKSVTSSVGSDSSSEAVELGADQRNRDARVLARLP
ncbi:hypothetical protein C8R46DRAFT_1031502 [Mycena filopes]|nr:hypothetical protein C8R46DRAFT_1031502 [Mycena filopes]